jgi:hypothetical protein
MSSNIILHLRLGLAGSLFFSWFSTQNEIYEYFSSGTEDNYLLKLAAVCTKFPCQSSEQVHNRLRFCADHPTNNNKRGQILG